MHEIRLAKPWTHTWQSRAQSLYAVYQRRFHRPTGLTEDQQVILVVTPRNPACGDSMRALLNEQPLSWQPKILEGEQAAFQTSVGDLLEPFNRLSLEVEWKAALQAIFPSPPELPQLSADNPAPPLFEQLFSVRLVIVDS
ncbi:MAG: hypothetical protein NXI32_28260 [bacterium]|nr:hypothetical protein [bacterium]